MKKGTLRDSIRWPSAPINAGRRVSAETTATATTSAAMWARARTISTPPKYRHSRATITVDPAKTTAPPAVAIERAIDSVGSIPPRICRWWRLMMKSE